jgi:hypothetical protein
VLSPNTSKFCHVTPVLESLHWLTIEQRIHCKILSLTHKALDTNHPTYLRSLLAVQDIRNTRSASIVSLVHPANPSRLKITNRSFFRALSPCHAENSSASPSPFALSPSQFHANSCHISSIILFLLNLFLFFWTFPSGS